MKKTLFLFIFLIFSNTARANLIITNFDENVKFTDFGREVNIKIKVKVETKPQYFYREWSYIFDKRLKIEVYNAKVVGKNYKTLFGNNELKFQFDRAFNGDIMEFQFSYTQFNDSDIKYIRQEYVLIPPFAKDAEGKLTVEVPESMIVYSLNPDFKQNKNIYTWQGKVSSDGFNDTFNLTLKQARWKVEMLTEVRGREKVSKIDMTIPLYFKNGNNIVESYKIKTNYEDFFTKIYEGEDSITVNFNNINGTKAQIKVEAIIKNDYDNKVWVKLNPSDYLYIDEKLSRDLQEYIYRVQLNNKNSTPLYILLAKWVNSYIQYDTNYFGKDMDTIKILSTARGVCTHYSELYNDLLRAAGIPSVMVSGVSYDIEKKEFENHSWNLVYINGEWIPIDPTWGIYSGKLPISHIFFFFNNGQPSIDYTVYGTSIDDFKSDIKRNIEFLEN